VWRGSTGRHAVALTFDDGPAKARRLSSTFSRSTCPATFFQVGANVDRLPEVARAVAAVATPSHHSYAHRCFVSVPRLHRADLRAPQQTIRAGTASNRNVRAPYGVRCSEWGAHSGGSAHRRHVEHHRARLAAKFRRGLGFCRTAPRWRYSVSTRRRELQSRPDITVTVEAVGACSRRCWSRVQFETVTQFYVRRADSKSH